MEMIQFDYYFFKMGWFNHQLVNMLTLEESQHSPEVRISFCDFIPSKNSIYKVAEAENPPNLEGKSSEASHQFQVLC